MQGCCLEAGLRRGDLAAAGVPSRNIQSSTLYTGACAAMLRGALCRPNREVGTACIVGSGDGVRPARGKWWPQRLPRSWQTAAASSGTGRWPRRHATHEKGPARRWRGLVLNDLSSGEAGDSLATAHRSAGESEAADHHRPRCRLWNCARGHRVDRDRSKGDLVGRTAKVD